MDHDHNTGLVRGVLHRSCNQAEGRILKWARLLQVGGKDIATVLRDLAAYEEANQYPLVYPKHMFASKEELRELSSLKSRYRKLKTADAKERISVRIKDLESTIRARSPDPYDPSKDGDVFEKTIPITRPSSQQVND